MRNLVWKNFSNNRVRIQVVPNIPVRIEEQNIEFSGAGQYLPQFQVIKVLPEQGRRWCIASWFVRVDQKHD